MPERRMGRYGPGPGGGPGMRGPGGPGGAEMSGAPWVDGPPGELSWGFEARRRLRTNIRAKKFLDTARSIDYSSERFFEDTYRITKAEVLAKHDRMPMLFVNLISGVKAIPKHMFRKSIYANELGKEYIGYGKKM